VTCAVVAQETSCDDVDEDCDGRTDEAFPTKGAECDDGALGVCKQEGVVACNAAGTNVFCDTSGSPPKGTASPEQCNALDDDCDGTTDEEAPDTMVEVRNATNTLLFRIYAYEASRPDSNALSSGANASRACSKPLVMPWATVTKDQADAACAAAGKRLCSAAEWQLACAGNGGLTYPYGSSYMPNACNGNDYDPDCAGADNDVMMPTGSVYGCPTKPAQSACVSAFGAFDMSGNLKEWTSTAAGSSVFKVRGGAYDSPAGGLSCQFDFVSMDHTFAFPNLGFRCCEDP
jgi:hypothetical protein